MLLEKLKAPLTLDLLAIERLLAVDDDVSVLRFGVPLPVKLFQNLPLGVGLRLREVAGFYGCVEFGISGITLLLEYLALKIGLRLRVGRKGGLRTKPLDFEIVLVLCGAGGELVGAILRAFAPLLFAATVAFPPPEDLRPS